MIDYNNEKIHARIPNRHAHTAYIIHVHTVIQLTSLGRGTKSP